MAAPQDSSTAVNPFDTYNSMSMQLFDTYNPMQMQLFNQKSIPGTIESGNTIAETFNPSISFGDNFTDTPAKLPCLHSTCQELHDSALSEAGGRRSRSPHCSCQKVIAGKEENKVDKLRERNRAAAAKFRVKKRLRTSHLVEKHRTQSMLYYSLKETKRLLRDELSALRNQALEHMCCNCQAIQDFNLQEARNFTAKGPLSSPTASESSRKRTIDLTLGMSSDEAGSGKSACHGDLLARSGTKSPLTALMKNEQLGPGTSVIPLDVTDTLLSGAETMYGAITSKSARPTSLLHEVVDHEFMESWISMAGYPIY